MKPIYEKLTQFPDEGFLFKEIRGGDCTCAWHVHPEYELILAVESAGHRIVGDNVSPLEPGDLVLIGPNLPHIYQHDSAPGGTVVEPRTLLIQFEEQYWSGVLQLPVLAPIRGLLQRAAVGLHFRGPARDRVAALMARMTAMSGARRIGAFLQVLEMLARCRAAQPLSSPGFAPNFSPSDEQRVNRVWQFINERLESELSVTEVARLIHMSEGAFSRFFRAHLGKSFPALVNDLRIGRACRLLAETEMNVTEIALACGYHNLSNFNRQFLRLKGTTPRAFRQHVGK